MICPLDHKVQMESSHRRALPCCKPGNQIRRLCNPSKPVMSSAMRSRATIGVETSPDSKNRPVAPIPPRSSAGGLSEIKRSEIVYRIPEIENQPRTSDADRSCRTLSGLYLKFGFLITSCTTLTCEKSSCILKDFNFSTVSHCTF